jgi:hypothetical protein
LLGQPYWLDTFPVDFRMPEAHLFFTAMTFPHVAVGSLLLLLSFRWLARGLNLQAPSWRQGWRRAAPICCWSSSTRS